MQTPLTDFQTWTRLLFNLLRGHHHLIQMRRGTRSNEVPLSYRGIRNYLSSLAPPALPTNSTVILLRGNAANWLQMNLQILEQHYVDMIAGIKTNLLRPVEIDHQRAWQVARAWATKKYRISEETMRRVGEDLKGVGLRIQQIPKGTTLRALKNVPSGRLHPRTYQEQRGSEAVGSSPPSTSKDTNPETEPDQQNPTEETPPPIPRPLLTTNPDHTITTEPRPPPRGPYLEEDHNEINPYRSPLATPATWELPPTGDLPTTPHHHDSTGPPDDDPPSSPADSLPSAQPRQCSDATTTGTTEPTTKDQPPSGTSKTPTAVPFQKPFQRPSFHPVTRDKQRARPAGGSGLLGPIGLFQKHLHRGDKYRDWSLTPTRPILILGASNMDRLPPIEDVRVQVDCYPGAKIAHAAHLLKYKTPVSTGVRVVILHFGFNDRSTTNVTRSGEDLLTLCRRAKVTFPLAKLRYAMITISSTLTSKEFKNMTFLNNIIQKTPDHIPKIKANRYVTTADGIHWSPGTGDEVWRLWKGYIDF